EQGVEGPGRAGLGCREELIQLGREGKQHRRNSSRPLAAAAHPVAGLPLLRSAADLGQWIPEAAWEAGGGNKAKGGRSGGRRAPPSRSPLNFAGRTALGFDYVGVKLSPAVEACQPNLPFFLGWQT